MSPVLLSPNKTQRSLSGVKLLGTVIRASGWQFSFHPIYQFYFHSLIPTLIANHFIQPLLLLCSIKKDLKR